MRELKLWAGDLKGKRSSRLTRNVYSPRNGLSEGKASAKKKVILIEGLGDDEKALVIEALTLLRRERGNAWKCDYDKAEREGKRLPGLGRYGTDDIKRLARRFGGRALHWMEE